MEHQIDRRYQYGKVLFEEKKLVSWFVNDLRQQQQLLH